MLKLGLEKGPAERQRGRGERGRARGGLVPVGMMVLGWKKEVEVEGVGGRGIVRVGVGRSGDVMK